MSRNVSSFYFRLSLKAGAKVQLLFYLASVCRFFFEKFISSFFNPFYSLNNSMNLLPFGSAKIITLFVSDKSFFEKILNPPTFQFTTTFTMNLSLIAGAKVILLFSF
jgi:hypothetical protein